MTAQPDFTGTSGPTSPMRTLAELRESLATHGLPSDRIRFEAELATVDLDDLTRVREIVQAYRHRVLLRRDEAAATALARTNEDVAAELRRKLGEAGPW